MVIVGFNFYFNSNFVINSFISKPINFYSDEEINPSSIKVTHIGELGETASHGFSSFKFVPGTQVFLPRFYL